MFLAFPILFHSTFSNYSLKLMRLCQIQEALFGIFALEVDSLLKYVALKNLLNNKFGFTISLQICLVSEALLNKSMSLKLRPSLCLCSIIISHKPSRVFSSSHHYPHQKLAILVQISLHNFLKQDFAQVGTSIITDLTI